MIDQPDHLGAERTGPGVRAALKRVHDVPTPAAVLNRLRPDVKVVLLPYAGHSIRRIVGAARAQGEPGRP